jgi:hypothetical protein
MQGDIPGSGPQFAAFKSDIAQRAIVQHVDAGELVAKAKISPDGFEQKYDNQHGLAFPRKTGAMMTFGGTVPLTRRCAAAGR